MIPNALNSTFSWYKANLKGNDLLTMKVTWPCCQTVQIPTYYIWGTYDNLYNFKDHISLLSPFFQKLEIKEMPYSHWILHESPKEISDLIREFIRKI